MKVISLTLFAHQESGALQAIDAAGPCKVLDKQYELFHLPLSLQIVIIILPLTDAELW